MQELRNVLSLNACLDHCALYTSRVPTDSDALKKICRGVSWQDPVARASGGNTCWLKTGVTNTTENLIRWTPADGALLLGF